MSDYIEELNNEIIVDLEEGIAVRDYDRLINTPIINQDLSASGFTPVTNSYYRHTGTTSETFTNNIIYFYNGTTYVDIAQDKDTTNYNNLSNKPKINNVELSGEKSLSDLGIASQSALETETSNRQSADTTLQNNIDSEATTRSSADTTLQNNINNEAIARQNADTSLENQVNERVKTSDVVNNVTSTDTNKPLSANMGKELQDEIDTLKARGRYLSVWNCVTGLPKKNPTTLPYQYKDGDYFIVGVVGITNYMPNGSSYTGVASTTLATETPKENDTYYYDGTNWSLLSAEEKSVTFSSIVGNPTDNTNLNEALNGIKNTLIPNSDGVINPNTRTSQTEFNNATEGTLWSDDIHWDREDLPKFKEIVDGENFKIGKPSTAIGKYTEASGRQDVAIGYNVHTSGKASTSIGSNVYVKGDLNTAIGRSIFIFSEDTYLISNNQFTISNTTYTISGSDPYTVTDGVNTYTLTNANDYTFVANSTTYKMYYTEGYVLNKTTRGEANTAIGTHIVLGEKNGAKVYRSTVIGVGISLSGNGYTGIGYYLVNNGNHNIGVGQDALTKGESNLSMGWQAQCRNPDTEAEVDGSIAIGGRIDSVGGRTVAGGDYDVVIGWNSQSTGDDNVNIGKQNQNTNDKCVMIGENMRTNEDKQIAIGNYNNPVSNAKLMIGDGDSINGVKNLLVLYKDGRLKLGGTYYLPTEDSDVIVKKYFDNIIATINNRIANSTVNIGTNSSSYDSGVAVGENAQALNGQKNVAVGANAKANGSDGLSVAVGASAEANYKYNVSLGYNNKCASPNQILIGNTNNTNGNIKQRIVAIGQGLEFSGHGQVVLGAFNDNETDSIFEIGAGAGALAKQNAFRVDRSGNVWATNTNTTGNVERRLAFADEIPAESSSSNNSGITEVQVDGTTQTASNGVVNISSVDITGKYVHLIKISSSYADGITLSCKIYTNSSTVLTKSTLAGNIPSMTEAYQYTSFGTPVSLKNIITIVSYTYNSNSNTGTLYYYIDNEASYTLHSATIHTGDTVSDTVRSVLQVV